MGTFVRFAKQVASGDERYPSVVLLGLWKYSVFSVDLDDVKEFQKTWTT